MFLSSILLLVLFSIAYIETKPRDKTGYFLYNIFAVGFSIHMNRIILDSSYSNPLLTFLSCLAIVYGVFMSSLVLMTHILSIRDNFMHSRKSIIYSIIFLVSFILFLTISSKNNLDFSNNSLIAKIAALVSYDVMAAIGSSFMLKLLDSRSEYTPRREDTIEDTLARTSSENTERVQEPVRVERQTASKQREATPDTNNLSEKFDPFKRRIIL